MTKGATVHSSEKSTRSIDEAPPAALAEEIAEADLFRPQAVDYANRRLEGDVVLAIPVSLRIYGLLIVAIVVAFAGFAATATYSRKESVSGWIQPEGGLIRVSALQPGVIEEMLVREGDMVRAGDPIAKLKLMHDVESGSAGNLLRESMNNESAAYRDQVSARLRTLEIQQQTLLRQRTTLMQNLVEAEYRETLAQERLNLSELDYNRNTNLADAGALAPSRVESARTALIGNQSALSQARSNILSLKRDLEETERALRSVPIEIASLQAEASVTEAQLAQRQTNTAAQAEYIVSASVSGEVLAVPVELGQVISGGSALVVLAPKGSRLVADLYVPSRAAGFIRPGQSVRIKYQAFPHEKFGAAAGEILRVSNTVLGPGETAIPGLQLQEPVFRVRVVLAKQSIDAYGETIPLQPGMLLNADVVVDRRSLFEWLLDPLYAVGEL